jgi:hypothetical protein
MRDAALSLPSVSELLDAFLPDADSAADEAVLLEAMSFDLPVELEAMPDDDGTVTGLGLSPPTQIIATTVMPVFHRLRLTLARSDAP